MKSLAKPVVQYYIDNLPILAVLQPLPCVSCDCVKLILLWLRISDNCSNIVALTELNLPNQWYFSWVEKYILRSWLHICICYSYMLAYTLQSFKGIQTYHEAQRNSIQWRLSPKSSTLVVFFWVSLFSPEAGSIYGVACFSAIWLNNLRWKYWNNKILFSAILFTRILKNNIFNIKKEILPALSNIAYLVNSSWRKNNRYHISVSMTMSQYHDIIIYHNIMTS